MLFLECLLDKFKVQSKTLLYAYGADLNAAASKRMYRQDSTVPPRVFIADVMEEIFLGASDVPTRKSVVMAVQCKFYINIQSFTVEKIRLYLETVERENKIVRKEEQRS